MAGGAELEGAATFQRTIREAARDVADTTVEAHAAGALMATEGRKDSPRRTGFLASTHGYGVSGPLIEVTATAPYATIVHSQNPWLERAVEDEDDHVADLYLAGLDRALARVKGNR